MRKSNINLIGITETFHPQVKYRGFVKILYIDRNSGRTRVIRQHNAGDEGLFTAITRALAGYDIQNHLPLNVMGYDVSGQEMFAQKIGYSSTPVLYSSKEAGDSVAINLDEGVNMIQYTFMIPANSLIATTDICKLVLFNKLGKKCATLDLPVGEQISTNTGSNILIYWKLKFE